jgi:protein TonB
METRKHTNNLQKSSVLFLQLGLVLTLLTTYLAFELKTEQRNATIIDNPHEIEDPEIYFIPDIIEIEREIVKKKKRIAKKQPSQEPVIDNTPSKEEDTLPFEPTDSEKDNPTDDDFVYVESEDDFKEDVPEVSYNSIQEVPIFPGCEKVKESKRRACFDKKMQSHIQRKFNSELSNQLGLSSGVKKIYVKFLITKTGEIEVIGAKASHLRLEKEGKRVVNKLPTMIPGKQNGEKVGVSYMLPIVFKVD